MVSAQYWQEAESQAVGLGGHLAAIGSQAENNWVTQTVIGPITDLSVWIGLRQLPGSIEPDQGWEWISGEPLIFTNWNDGEPNNLGNVEHFGEFFYLTGKWNDTSEQGLIPFQYGVVEVVPEPATIWLLGIGTIALIAKRRQR